MASKNLADAQDYPERSTESVRETAEGGLDDARRQVSRFSDGVQEKYRKLSDDIREAADRALSQSARLARERYEAAAEGARHIESLQRAAIPSLDPFDASALTLLARVPADRVSFQIQLQEKLRTEQGKSIGRAIVAGARHEAIPPTVSLEEEATAISLLESAGVF